MILEFKCTSAVYEGNINAVSKESNDKLILTGLITSNNIWTYWVEFLRRESEAR